MAPDTLIPLNFFTSFFHQLLGAYGFVSHYEPDGRANGHAHLGKADGHFDWRAGAALQQDDGDYGCGQVGLIVQQRDD